MLILVLALVWVIALSPVIVRKASEYQVFSSVARFRHRTGLMRQAYPQLAAAALPDAPLLVAGEAIVTPEMRRAARARHRRTIERRRRALVTLVSTCLGSLLLGVVPALRALWGLSLASLLLTATYLALLAYLTQAETNASERRRKVIPMPGAPSRPFLPDAYATAVGHHGSVTMPPIVALPSRPSFVLVDAPT
jgi:hypothetical protein